MLATVTPSLSGRRVLLGLRYRGRDGWKAQREVHHSVVRRFTEHTRGVFWALRPSR